MKWFHSLFISVLSFVLHHANRYGGGANFYKIKKNILDKHGIKIGYDVQTIDGKDCYSCYGTGKVWYSSDDEDYTDCDECCGTGLWKDPFYVILNRYKLDKYTFHQPGERNFNGTPSAELLAGATSRVGGYIQHTQSRYSKYCRYLLYLFYDFNHFCRCILPYYFFSDFYYDYELLRPKHLFVNLIHVCRHRFRNVPLLKRLKDVRAINRADKIRLEQIKSGRIMPECEDLPF